MRLNPLILRLRAWILLHLVLITVMPRTVPSLLPVAPHTEWTVHLPVRSVRLRLGQGGSLRLGLSLRLGRDAAARRRLLGRRRRRCGGWLKECRRGFLQRGFAVA